MTLSFVRIMMGLFARIEIIYFSIKMASEFNSKFDSDIQVNPCRNRPSSPFKLIIEESSSPVSRIIVRCHVKPAQN